MKAVILAGGLGSRLTEETSTKPKPMVEIGGRPILWHIMKHYASHGVNDFLICLGYKGYVIKEYFANYFLHMSDVTFDLANNHMDICERHCEPWRITLVDTGEHSQTGGRLRRVRRYLQDETAFCFTYGDGLSDVDITALVQRHRQSGTLATVTTVYPPGRFGAVELEGGYVRSCQEKPRGDGSLINGGFFVLSPRVIDFIEGDDTVWERGPMQRLAQAGELTAHVHDGFWQPMDTLRDKHHLERLWQSGSAPWKSWP